MMHDPAPPARQYHGLAQVAFFAGLVLSILNGIEQADGLSGMPDFWYQNRMLWWGLSLGLIAAGVYGLRFHPEDETAISSSSPGTSPPRTPALDDVEYRSHRADHATNDPRALRAPSDPLNHGGDATARGMSVTDSETIARDIAPTPVAPPPATCAPSPRLSEVAGQGLPGVTVYLREGCHLCHHVLELLRQIDPVLPDRVINIDADPELRAQWNTCVPVVEIDGQVRFRGRVEPALLRRQLAHRGPRSV